MKNWQGRVVKLCVGDMEFDLGKEWFDDITEGQEEVTIGASRGCGFEPVKGENGLALIITGAEANISSIEYNGVRFVKEEVEK